MKHKVLIDSISLLSALTGIGRYTYEISYELSKSDEYDLDFYYGYISKNLLKPEKISYAKGLITKVPVLKKIVRTLLQMSTKLFASRYDLYWQPNFIPLEGIKAKKVITTVHDFSFIIYRDFHPKERIEYFEKSFLKSVQKSDIIITGSHFSKSEILDRLEFKEEDIYVIYHGVNHDIFHIYQDTKLEFDIPDKFILSVGSIEPRKNLLGLLKAYNLFDDEFKSIYKLVLVGFKGWENREIMDIVDKNSENIIYLGYLSDEELAKVYNRATCFVYPSFYEGFGLPPLEAMACGTPVITSKLSSIPEVCSDSVIYCDAYDIDDIKEKIEILLKDETLKKELIEKGIKRASLFTWKRSADMHKELFLKVLEG
jgi:glycosyltransferase involved in cell wall biosynthesis